MSISTFTILFPDSGYELPGLSTLSVQNNFRDGIGAFSFSVEDNRATAFAQAIQPGTKIQIRLDKKPQLTGRIDKVERGEGMISCSGRDILGYADDCSIDIHQHFKAGQTIDQVVKTVLLPLGITSIDGDDLLNQRAIVGADDEGNGGGKTQFGAIACKTLKQGKREGSLQFIKRMLLRFGLFIYAKADGSGVVITKPNYSGTAFHKCIRNISGIGNTIETGKAIIDISKQASAFYSMGHGSQEIDDAKVRIKSVAINELTGTSPDFQTLPSVATEITREHLQGARILPLNAKLEPYRYLLGDAVIPPRIAFDSESQSNTQSEIEQACRLKLAYIQSECVKLEYDLSGFGQTGIPFAVNRMVSVHDERTGVFGSFWVLERQFSQGVSGGSRTKLTLGIPYLL